MSICVFSVNPLITPLGQAPSPTHEKRSWELPDITDIDPEMLKPIPDAGENTTWIQLEFNM